MLPDGLPKKTQRAPIPILPPPHEALSSFWTPGEGAAAFKMTEPGLPSSAQVYLGGNAAVQTELPSRLIPVLAVEYAGGGVQPAWVSSPV